MIQGILNDGKPSRNKHSKTQCQSSASHSYQCNGISHQYFSGNIHSNIKKGAGTSIMLAVSPHVRELRGYFFSEGVPSTPSSKARYLLLMNIASSVTQSSPHHCLPILQECDYTLPKCESYTRQYTTAPTNYNSQQQRMKASSVTLYVMCQYLKLCYSRGVSGCFHFFQQSVFRLTCQIICPCIYSNEVHFLVRRNRLTRTAYSMPRMVLILIHTHKEYIHTYIEPSSIYICFEEIK